MKRALIPHQSQGGGHVFAVGSMVRATLEPVSAHKSPSPKPPAFLPYAVLEAARRGDLTALMRLEGSFTVPRSLLESVGPALLGSPVTSQQPLVLEGRTARIMQVGPGGGDGDGNSDGIPPAVLGGSTDSSLAVPNRGGAVATLGLDAIETVSLEGALSLYVVLDADQEIGRLHRVVAFCGIIADPSHGSQWNPLSFSSHMFAFCLIPVTAYYPFRRRRSGGRDGVAEAKRLSRSRHALDATELPKDDSEESGSGASARPAVLAPTGSLPPLSRAEKALFALVSAGDLAGLRDLAGEDSTGGGAGGGGAGGGLWRRVHPESGASVMHLAATAISLLGDEEAADRTLAAAGGRRIGGASAAESSAPALLGAGPGAAGSTAAVLTTTRREGGLRPESGFSSDSGSGSGGTVGIAGPRAALLACLADECGAGDMLDARAFNGSTVRGLF